MSDNRPRDPLDPRRDPAGFDPLVPGADPRYSDPLPGEPGSVNYVDARRSGSSAGLVLAAVFAVLLVIGFIAFSGEGVDPEATATIPGGPAATDEMAPPAATPQPMEPAPAQEAEPPAAAPPPAAPAPAQ